MLHLPGYKRCVTPLVKMGSFQFPAIVCDQRLSQIDFSSSFFNHYRVIQRHLVLSNAIVKLRVRKLSQSFCHRNHFCRTQVINCTPLCSLMCLCKLSSSISSSSQTFATIKRFQLWLDCDGDSIFRIFYAFVFIGTELK